MSDESSADATRDRDAAARMDPERAVDELEERILGRRTHHSDTDASDDSVVDPVESEEPGDSGTGVAADPAD